MLLGMSLSVQNLTHAYVKGKNVLEDVTLKVDQGELVAVVGRSGCGKSTLLHCIAGLITPKSGAIQIDGKDVTDAAPHLRGVGIMMQDHPLYEHLTVEKNIAFPLRARGEKKPDVFQILELFQLQDIAQQKVSTCSGGERRRVALGRAIVLQPSVLLLDEPFVSLNAELREMIRMYIQELTLTTLLVTHDLEEVESIADSVVRLEN